MKKDCFLNIYRYNLFFKIYYGEIMEIESLISIVTSPFLWIGIILMVTLKKGIHFVPQNRGYVVYTLGKYTKTLSAGMNFIIPYFQYIAADRNLKEKSYEIPSQSAITKDNISLQIDGVLYIKVVDASAATNNITDYKSAVVQLAMTSMRNAIGSMELDDCFQKRDEINAVILKSMSEATQPWGVQVTRYEIMDIAPPASIIEDMEKQMSAEREKRSVILTAEGYKTSEVAKAEGNKQARILDAEAKNREQILKAEAEKISTVLESEGEAAALMNVAQAKADSIRIIGEEASSDSGKFAVQLELAEQAIDAHKAIAKEGTVILSDGKTSENIANTVAQALSVSMAIRKD
jgi:regulator of protease activity HflC (stomatin/prohibitin superfamily)